MFSTLWAAWIEAIATGFAAIATFAAVIVALFGDPIRRCLCPPKLKLKLVDPEGTRDLLDGGKETTYFHILVHNENPHTPANRVRVRITEFEKKRADGNGISRRKAIPPLQLHWAYPKDSPDPYWRFPTIDKTDDYCDLGRWDEDWNWLQLCVYNPSHKVMNRVSKGESLKLWIQAFAENSAPSEPLVVNISWEGECPRVDVVSG